MQQALFSVAVALLAAAAPAHAGPPDALLERYGREAQQADPAFAGFSAERGRAFYYDRHPLPGVGAVSCASCHRRNPRDEIRWHRVEVLCRACHVINDEEHPDPAEAKKRVIGPFAPAANPERFADAEKVERYFRTNCRMLLQRECSAQEKGDLITWLLTIQGPAVIPPTPGPREPAPEEQ
jgi:hypothetical protein